MARTFYQFRVRRQAFLRWMARRNVSQNDLARRCGISSGFMSQLLSGKRNAGPKTRARIAAAFPRADFDKLFQEIELDG
jgi:transcriptional regulator with XRE-family HTH domain